MVVVKARSSRKVYIILVHRKETDRLPGWGHQVFWFACTNIDERQGHLSFWGSYSRYQLIIIIKLRIGKKQLIRVRQYFYQFTVGSIQQVNFTLT